LAGVGIPLSIAVPRSHSISNNLMAVDQTVGGGWPVRGIGVGIAALWAPYANLSNTFNDRNGDTPSRGTADYRYNMRRLFPPHCFYRELFC